MIHRAPNPVGGTSAAQRRKARRETRAGPLGARTARASRSRFCATISLLTLHSASRPGLKFPRLAAQLPVRVPSRGNADTQVVISPALRLEEWKIPSRGIKSSITESGFQETRIATLATADRICEVVIS